MRTDEAEEPIRSSPLFFFVLSLWQAVHTASGMPKKYLRISDHFVSFLKFEQKKFLIFLADPSSDLLFFMLSEALT